MNTKKVIPIVALVTAATIFALSSVLVNPVLAQSTTGGAGGTGSSTTGGAGGTGSSTAGGAGGTGSSTAGGTSGSASADYEEFQMCLSDVETSGVATEEQIRECFNPIYNENGDSSSSDSSSEENGSSGSDNGGDTTEGEE
jgi:hypothetical protein